MSPESKKLFLKKRAEAFKKARFFFDNKGYFEVDCPSLRSAPPLDNNIDVFELNLSDQPNRYLHTSPEYGMKCLLAEEVGNIYQISHVFRKEELGKLHNPEFTMAEWYKTGIDFNDFIDETCDFIKLFIASAKIIKKTYRDLFLEFVGIDYLTATKDELIQYIESCPISCSGATLELDIDSLLQWIMGIIIEPLFQGDHLWVITHFPKNQAALSEIVKIGNDEVALRFEIYYKGIELANGYKELTNSKEQKRRFEEANKIREAQGKPPYPIDQFLVKALEKGIPPCCGVAAGFDRLIMLSLGKTSIHDILPLSWQNT